MRRDTFLISFFTVCWLVALAAGIFLLAAHSNRSVLAGMRAPAWPADSTLSFPSGGNPVLVLFLNHKCPHASDSLREFDDVMEQTGRKAKGYVLFVQLEGWSEKEVKGDLWQKAREMPGVESVVDPGGEEAMRFGAKISGLLMAYDHRQRLWFRGGIIGSRPGLKNPGKRLAIEFVRNGTQEFRESRVFGSGIFQSVFRERRQR